ncbi:hypothetical protein HY768_02415 [candidate division TA06 bacterium]|uniref:Uncharacterized protein n=1 Tax=candidate division TA06 bacterium TaxID=2250710 RepID=A0A933I9Z5_UNCT6|nr:hypothetical protein [candidate division TA06 bacterium]
MKHINRREIHEKGAFLVTIVVLFSCVVMAQQNSSFQNNLKDEKPKTAIEEVLLKKGQIIQRDFFLLGEIRGMKFETLLIYELQ